MLSKVLYLTPAVLVASTNVDCEYSVCDRPLSRSDCEALGATCRAYGGVPSCQVGEFEYECNNINLFGGDTCANDIKAASICAEFSYADIVSCRMTEGDCDLTPYAVTKAPTPATAYGFARVDCSYDSCTLPLTSSDCSSLMNQCRNHGGVGFCEPGDNEFECNNLPFSGSGVCSDATATSQCMSYDYPGYTCFEKEGDCDSAILSTLGPTPVYTNIPRIDCEYDSCATMLTAEDCEAVRIACNDIGGISFCVPGTKEFECNNIAWTGGALCQSDLANAQCMTYDFPIVCTEKDGDCSSLGPSSTSSNDEQLSDTERVAIAFAVPLGIVGFGGVMWYAMSKRNMPPMAESEVQRGTL